MTHPEELLAGYVDGTLSEKERAVLDAHLATCDTCTEELRLAARARNVLRELPDVPVPITVMRPVLAAAGMERARRASGRWRSTVGWAAGLAAAAAVVAVLAINVLPGLGGGAGGTGPLGAAKSGAPAIRAADAGAEASLAVVPFVSQPDVNYDPDKVRQLAAEAANESTGLAAVPSPDQEAAAIHASTVAVDCVRTGSSITPNDRPVKIVDARYQGRPAYLAVFLESPSPGQPPNRVVVWIVAKSGCRLISFASERIQ